MTDEFIELLKAFLAGMVGGAVVMICYVIYWRIKLNRLGKLVREEEKEYERSLLDE